MIEVKAHGTFIETDADGYLCNPSSFDKLQPAWLDLIESAKDTYLTHCAAQLHSIYLRGSVARGAAVPGISDLDSFAVLKPGITDADSSWEDEAIRTLQTDHPITNDIEFDLWPYEEALDRSHVYSFVLKTFGLSLHGPDLTDQIEPFKPNAEIMHQVRNLAEGLAAFEAELAVETDPVEIAGAGAWLMKRIVRSGFELVMEHEGTYTRDLYPCYATFAKYYPQQKAAMRQALEWAINPIADKAAYQAFVADFGAWLLAEVKAWQQKDITNHV
jgi:hypothetical protein